MNFIDKDAVVATLKKHVQEECHSYFCKCLLSEIDALEVKEQPSLPSNLDEAAEKAYKEYDVKTAVKPKEHPVGFLFFDGFKAGAEWMAGQGATCNGEIQMDFSAPADIYARRLSADYWNELGPALMKVEPGKVLIQIRKKQ